ncbi:hypothetical protein R3P38DRAFT_2794614 [Favolaschia claudopus]|uniref:Uncharacterized protein n=1 Tax=Favolaschia claudopus TaxID=2862362 RepID=A0AAW0A9K7_9AGAR
MPSWSFRDTVLRTIQKRKRTRRKTGGDGSKGRLFSGISLVSIAHVINPTRIFPHPPHPRRRRAHPPHWKATPLSQPPLTPCPLLTFSALTSRSGFYVSQMGAASTLTSASPVGRDWSRSLSLWEDEQWKEREEVLVLNAGGANSSTKDMEGNDGGDGLGGVEKERDFRSGDAFNPATSGRGQESDGEDSTLGLGRRRRSGNDAPAAPAHPQPPSSFKPPGSSSPAPPLHPEPRPHQQHHVPPPQSTAPPLRETIQIRPLRDPHPASTAESVLSLSCQLGSAGSLASSSRANPKPKPLIDIAASTGGTMEERRWRRRRMGMDSRPGESSVVVVVDIPSRMGGGNGQEKEEQTPVLTSRSPPVDGGLRKKTVRVHLPLHLRVP